MAELLTNTTKYKKSMEILENMEDLSPGMKEAYQTVSLRQARLDLKENRIEGALVNFKIRFSLRRSEEHTSELQSRGHLVCRLLLEKKKRKKVRTTKAQQDLVLKM